jgi:hypothetical protein
MLDTAKRAVIPLTAAVVSLLALLLSGKDRAWLCLLVVTLPIVATGLYDWLQKR